MYSAKQIDYVIIAGTRRERSMEIYPPSQAGLMLPEWAAGSGSASCA